VNGNSLLKEIGRSYIVSSFIPVSLFVFLTVFLFRDFAPQWVIKRFRGDFLLFNGTIAFLAFFVLWLAFALYSSQDPITRLFEGYYFPQPFKLIFTKIQAIRRWFKMRRINKAQEAFIEQTQVASNSSNSVEKDLYSEAISDFQPLELEVPIETDLLPTRLGNVLRASEVYPFYRYGIDGITIWPRLYNFLPHDIKDDLEKINNQLAFLLNSTLLVIILVLACFSVASIQNLCIQHSGSWAICDQNIWLKGFRQFSYLFYYYSALGGVIISYVLYCLAVSVAVTYGLYVRTAYDLYRHRLLEHLNKTLTEKLDDEKETWEKIGDYYIAGDYFKPIQFGKTQKQLRFKVYAGLVLASSLAAGLVFKIARSQKCR
jgi:hypothetical protein